jgi:hypothetical protein
LCENFAVHAGTAVTFSGGMNTINGGDVGVFPGTSITGNYMIDGGEFVSDSSDFADSVLAAYNDAMRVETNEEPLAAQAGASQVIDDEQHIAIEIGGLTFIPGTYRSATAITIAAGTVVTLDGLDEANPVFTFIASTGLVTAVDTSFNLINGAKAENVIWALGTAATLGARSVVEGSILAGTAITFGPHSELHGCALAQSAVTFASNGSVDLNHYVDDGLPNNRNLRG